MKSQTRQTFLAPSELVDPSRPARVLVIGAGGTGGEVLDHLCRLHATLVALEHPGLSVTVYDGDTVSASNVGRQRFSPMDVGENKAVSLVNRINLFYGLDWESVPFHWDLEDEITHTDLTITATDSAELRHSIAANNDQRRSFYIQSNDLWLDFGNGAHTGQAILGHLARDVPNLRLPHVIDLYPDMVDDPNDGPSCSVEEAIRQQGFGVNTTLVANAFATLVWPMFRHGQIDRHGLFMNVREGSVVPLNIDPVEWSMFGYEPASASEQATASSTLA